VGYEEEKAHAKRLELHALIAKTLATGNADAADQIAADVLEAFADITAPYYEPPPIQLITLREGGYGGGSTTKPGNVRLNLRKLVMAIAGGTITIGGALATPWLLIPGALLTWDALWSCLNLEITEAHACVVWGLWIARDEDNTVRKSEVVEIVNRERKNYGRQALSAQEINDALGDLAKMSCIQESRGDRERWWLREWVRIKYQ
jgi:hypothetical protein